MGKQRHDQGQKKRLLSRNDRTERDDDTEAMARRLFQAGLASAGIFGGEHASKPRRRDQ